VRDGIPVLMHYGFSSAMPIGGDKVVIHGNGQRASAIAVATGHQAHRFTGLLTGEAVLYDMWGHSLRLTSGGAVLTGDLHVTGAVIAGFGGTDQVGVQTHQHGTGAAAAGTSAPSPGT
jgi:phage gp45-like